MSTTFDHVPMVMWTIHGHFRFWCVPNSHTDSRPCCCCYCCWCCVSDWRGFCAAPLVDRPNIQDSHFRCPTANAQISKLVHHSTLALMMLTTTALAVVPLLTIPDCIFDRVHVKCTVNWNYFTQNQLFDEIILTLIFISLFFQL